LNTISIIKGFEVLDSRGKPTVMVRCTLENGISAEASVPSGASTGSMEALELRDQNASRFNGNGCLKAVQMINDTIGPSLQGRKFNTQSDLDQSLLTLDGTSDKSNLGANSMLAVSLAYAKVTALSAGKPLHKHFSDESGITPSLPRPMINLFSGGIHGGNQTSVQDLQLLMPGTNSVQRSLEIFYDVYYTAATRMKKNHGLRLLRADEGGLAPPFKSSEEMFQEALLCIEEAGYVPGQDCCFTVDVAATHFYQNGRYLLDSQPIEAEQMVELLASWCDKYPLVSIEDGLAESDWPAWKKLTQRIGQQTMVLGDDLLCTNPKLIQKAITEQAANSLLLKVNQIGTLSEAFEAYRLAKADNWKVVISTRSGETEDNWLADLAVGWAGDFIKIGSITQSDRLAKYNRLLVIEFEFE